MNNPTVAKVTERERLVAVGIANGKTYQQIADQEGLGLETVRAHAASLRKKLQTNKAGIAAWAVREGFVT